MTPQDLVHDLRSRINPAYASQLGTESYERRLCAEAIEGLLTENERLRAALEKAADDIESWGAYASQYFQDKWNLQADIDAARAALGES